MGARCLDRVRVKSQSVKHTIILWLGLYAYAGISSA